jgi:nitrate reductase gamma subunit
MAITLIITYASIAVLVIAVIAKFIKFKSMPIHLRWELYPVPHEKGKGHYGGSFLEEFEWWKQKREHSALADLVAMIAEILFLKGVWEHNKSQWVRSFPFHFGLYMLIGTFVLLLAGGIALAAGVDVSAEGGVLGMAIYHLTYLVGWGGLSLALLGSILLLGRRMFNANYAEFTKGADYFNLLFFVVTLAVAVGAHATADPYFVGLRGYYQQLITFNLAWEGGLVLNLMTAEIILGSLLAAYIPMTHMSHFVGKFFMYHDIRWADEPNMRGSEIEKKIGVVLQYPVSWKAAHIRGDGKKTWAEVATSGVEEQ